MNYGWWEPFQIKGLVKGRIFKTGWTAPYPDRGRTLYISGMIENTSFVRELLASLK